MRKLWDLLRNKIGTKNLICGILGICIAVGWMWSFTAWRVALVDKKICETQRGIADEVFRFHVLANSDSEKDQRVKLKVRDAVIAYMTSEMPIREYAPIIIRRAHEIINHHPASHDSFARRQRAAERKAGVNWR